MKKLFYILCFFTLVSNAQKIEIGDVKKMQSQILNEEREYWISLPENYSNENFQTQKYPVIYLLDGEKHFNVTTGIVQSLSRGYYPLIPECIIVAIKNTNRSRDLTPTNDSTLSYETGGANQFASFINKELIPEINRSYRTLDYKILIGHSFGGLFSLNILFNNPSNFNAYITIDPSLWWDNNLLVNNLEKNIQTTDYKGSILFFANANSIGKQKVPNKQHDNHFKAKKRTLEILSNTTPKKLNYSIKYYEDEDHGSVVLPSIIDGLRSVFTGFRINVKELIKSPDLLKKSYQNLSNNLSYEIKPQAAYIDRVVDLALKRNEKENAEILNDINKKLYSDNDYLKNKLK
jgi:predicted alpha/beta superfamily hydrolase